MKLKEMKILKKLLFTTILVIGCSLFAFGQQNDGQKDPPPPKRDPPKIDPKPKETPKPTPKPKNPNVIIVGLEAKAIVAD